MGKKKKSESELQEQKHMKTDISRGENAAQNLTSPPDMEEQSPTLPRLATLKAILREVRVPAQIWPKEALKATLKRFERMPRKGWDLMHKFYIGKFAKEISPIEFLRKAENTIVSNSGRGCSRRKFTEECSCCIGICFEPLMSIKDLFNGLLY